MLFQVVTDFGGQIPRTADELMKSLPGVGRYTSSMSKYSTSYSSAHPSPHTSPRSSPLPLFTSPPPLFLPFSPILSTLLCRCNSIHCIWAAVWGGGWECGEGVLATKSRGSMHRGQTNHGTLLVWTFSPKTEAVWLVRSLSYGLK